MAGYNYQWSLSFVALLAMVCIVVATESCTKEKVQECLSMMGSINQRKSGGFPSVDEHHYDIICSTFRNASDCYTPFMEECTDETADTNLNSVKSIDNLFGYVCGEGSGREDTLRYGRNCPDKPTTGMIVKDCFSMNPAVNNGSMCSKLDDLFGCVDVGFTKECDQESADFQVKVLKLGWRHMMMTKFNCPVEDDASLAVALTHGGLVLAVAVITNWLLGV